MKMYSQNDLRWRNKRLGTSRLTIGSHGCAITCIAMMSGVTPTRVNEYLKNNNGYLNGSLVKWAFAGNLPNIHFDGNIIESYYPRIAEVGGLVGVPQHFVVFEDSAWIIDPWDGRRKSFAHSGYSFRSWRNVYQFGEEIILSPKEMTNSQIVHGILIVYLGLDTAKSSEARWVHKVYTEQMDKGRSYIDVLWDMENSIYFKAKYMSHEQFANEVMVALNVMPKNNKEMYDEFVIGLKSRQAPIDLIRAIMKKAGIGKDTNCQEYREGLAKIMNISKNLI